MLVREDWEVCSVTSDLGITVSPRANRVSTPCLLSSLRPLDICRKQNLSLRYERLGFSDDDIIQN